MSLDLSVPIREAILRMSSITDLLGTYMGEPSIHTRRPVPGAATYPLIVISSDIIVSNQDALTKFRPIVMRDIAVYGQTLRESLGDQVDDYRNVEAVGYDLREQFHRQKGVLYVEDYHVIDIVAAGPIVAPTGDDRMIGRVVTLTIRLDRRA